MLLKPMASDDEDAAASAVQKDESTGKEALQSVSDIVNDEQAQQKAVDEALTIGDEESGATGSPMNETQENAMSYRMRHALDAYSMTMGMVA